MVFGRGFLPFYAGEISWFAINSKLLSFCALWQNIWYSMILSCSSPSPTSWPGWACQCLWQSPIFLKAITYFSKLARSSLTMFMARTIVISKPKSMLFNLLEWFSEGLQPPFKGYFLSFWQHLTHCDRWTERWMDIRTCRGALAANKMFYVLFVFIYYQVYSM